MLAVVSGDGDLRIEERPDPVPGDTELLVAVRAAGLNGADQMQRHGRYPAPPGVPADILGLELAGEVAGVGRQVTRFTPGDPVMAVVGGGGQATMAAVDEAHALAVPPGVGWAQAGGFPETFSTAHDALFTQCRLAVGERVLVTGAAGGVGTAGVQLAAAAGAAVVASARDRSHHDALLALGAAEVIGPDEVADHGPYDVVLELVGAPSLPGALSALATGGRASVIGVGGGARIDLDLLGLMTRRASVRGSTLRARSRTEKALVAGAVAAHVLPLLGAGRIAVPMWATFPLEEAGVAYDRFAQGGKLGKIVLVT
ncbi:MAG TPA: zinc-binding dehydrogenase [Acidimicrobiales bacterium]|nr:zinc-binding dehydrogenase [Acidimicrobiales bacterium]